MTRFCDVDWCTAPRGHDGGHTPRRSCPECGRRIRVQKGERWPVAWLRHRYDGSCQAAQPVKKPAAQVRPAIRDYVPTDDW